MNNKRIVALIAIIMLSGCDTLKDKEYDRCMSTVNKDFKSDKTIKAHCRHVSNQYINSFTEL